MIDFYYKNKEIASPKDYKLGDEAYKRFVLYALNKDFDYTTGSEKTLERLKEVAQGEQYYEAAKEEFDALVKSLSPDKKRDLKKFKDEITMLVENEIIGRYYFQEGQMTHDLMKDDYVLKAIEILTNKAEYDKILKP